MFLAAGAEAGGVGGDELLAELPTRAARTAEGLFETGRWSQDPTPRRAADPADVHKANWGCDSRGGAVFTDLPPIAWQTDTSGTIGGPPVATEFTATLGPDGQWDVNILAC
jgi:hypothetical protein